MVKVVLMTSCGSMCSRFGYGVVASVTIVEELNIGDLLSSINVLAVNFFLVVLFAARGVKRILKTIGVCANVACVCVVLSNCPDV